MGRVEIRVNAGDTQRVLTSSLTYNTGSLRSVNISLEGSRLFLRTPREVVQKGLQRVPVESLQTYTEYFVGGMEASLQERLEVDQGNFTGCINVVSSGFLRRPFQAPKCAGLKNREVLSSCSYCSAHQASQRSSGKT